MELDPFHRDVLRALDRLQTELRASPSTHDISEALSAGKQLPNVTYSHETTEHALSELEQAGLVRQADYGMAPAGVPAATPLHRWEISPAGSDAL